MSVCIFDKDEMQDLCDQLIQLAHMGIIGVHCPEAVGRTPIHSDHCVHIGWVLECAWIAQYAAYARTYAVREDADEGARFGDLWPHPLKVGDRLGIKGLDQVKIADKLHSLRYNCVSNGGTDFCPAEVRKDIEAWMMQLYRNVASGYTDHLLPAEAYAIPHKR